MVTDVPHHWWEAQWIPASLFLSQGLIRFFIAVWALGIRLCHNWSKVAGTTQLNVLTMTINRTALNFVSSASDCLADTKTKIIFCTVMTNKSSLGETSFILWFIKAMLCLCCQLYFPWGFAIYLFSIFPVSIHDLTLHRINWPMSPFWSSFYSWFTYQSALLRFIWHIFSDIVLKQNLFGSFLRRNLWKKFYYTITWFNLKSVSDFFVCFFVCVIHQ